MTADEVRSELQEQLAGTRLVSMHKLPDGRYVTTIVQRARRGGGIVALRGIIKSAGTGGGGVPAGAK